MQDINSDGLSKKNKKQSAILTKTDYILRSLSKIVNKRWEHYIINRIYHRLDDPDIEFVCQQCIRKKDGKVYLADLYFPQFDIYLEIDEAHHASNEMKNRDAKRRFDIAEVSDFTEKRIDTNQKTLNEINTEIEQFINTLQTKKSESLDFSPWDYENRFNPEIHIKRGFIEIGPHSTFRYQKDALACFGYTKGHFQRGAWTIPLEISQKIGLQGESMVWFPRLYKNDNWENSLSGDGTLIIEKNTNPDYLYERHWDYRIVMARTKDHLGRTLYNFVGVFENIPEYSSGYERRFRRINTKVNTIGTTR
jgi:very-short-patch-repair endonuclease